MENDVITYDIIAVLMAGDPHFWKDNLKDITI